MKTLRKSLRAAAKRKFTILAAAKMVNGMMYETTYTNCLTAAIAAS